MCLLAIWCRVMVNSIDTVSVGIRGKLYERPGINAAVKEIKD